MKIEVFGDENSWNELTAINAGVTWIRAAGAGSLFEHNDTAAFFNLSSDAALQDYSKTHKPVFINSVSATLKEIKAPGNVIRINGWSGFLARPVWEIAGSLSTAHDAILAALQKKSFDTPDEPGFVSARIISMIINEAYFAMEENISTENEIDIAMKLGTNYPFGPFEWSRRIGVKNIYALLVSLYKNDIRYKPSSLLQQKATNP